jgi:hypothetical protein
MHTLIFLLEQYVRYYDLSSSIAEISFFSHSVATVVSVRIVYISGDNDANICVDYCIA